MWGGWLDKGKELAEQAKRAAAELEGRLDESAGIQPTGSAGGVDVTTISADEDEALNDNWDDDEEEAQFVVSSPREEKGDHPPLQQQQPETVKEEEEQQAATGEEIGNGGGGWAADEEEDLDLGDDDEGAQQETTVPTASAQPPPEEPTTAPETFEAPTTTAAAEKEEQQPAKEPEPAAVVAHGVGMEEKGAVRSAPQEQPDEERIGAVEKEREEEEYVAADVPKTDEKEPEEEVEAKSGGGFFGALAHAAHAPKPKDLLGGLSHLTHQIPLGKGDKEEAEEEEEQEQEDQAKDSQQVESLPVDRQPEAVEMPPKPVEHAETEDPPKEETGEEPPESTPQVANFTDQTKTAPEFSNSQSLPPDELARIMEQQSEYTQMMEARMDELQQKLGQREEQLFSKTEQLTMMENMHESEKQELIQKIQSTKEEAKRRIQKAKERVEAMELKLKNATSSQGSSAEETEKQAEIINALREEGEKLARKQADMEAAVRSAKGEARELREELEDTNSEKEKALEKIASLQTELKKTQDDLSSARKGESQAEKLDTDLRQAREESEKRAANILSLEQQIKELKASQKELKTELESTRKGAAVETEQERKKLRKEHNDQVADLESKLQKSEREAAVREDALRHEVDELRKRWQDAVRRADALSVDVQSSTAPLLRQLESTNKQNRARAAAWAELETQLRAELEESVISNEQLAKERSEWKTKCTRLERSTKEHETELKQMKGELHDKTEKVQQLEHELEELKAKGEKMKTEWAEVERLANEGVSRVRSEMTRTVVDAEERHRSQIESMEARLAQERDERTKLEKKLEGLLENAGMFVPEESSSLPLATVVEDKPKKLRNSEGQVEILAGALGGFGSDGENSDDEDENDASNRGSGSFAALEQLTSRLKASKVELTTLRNRLQESEKTREELVQVLAESRNAREKLPLFEAKVHELTAENEELTLEVQGLREDIVETREMYRTQLNVLLEAQAAAPPQANGDSKPAQENVEPTEEKPAQENGTVEAAPSSGAKSADI